MATNDFEEYLAKYAAQYNISVEEAKTHALVEEVKRHYEGTNKSDNAWW